VAERISSAHRPFRICCAGARHQRRRSRGTNGVALPTPCVGLMAPPALVNLVLTFGGGNTVRSTQMVKGWTSAALLACMLGLVGCAGSAGLLFNNTIVVDHL